MFRKRLTWLSLLLGVLTLVIIARLVQIQVVDAAWYEALAEQILTGRPQYLAAPRGAILDRRGRPLVTDEPTWAVCLHYPVLTDRAAVREEYLAAEARRLRRSGQFPAETPVREIVAQLEAELEQMWPRLAVLVGRPEAELRQSAAEACAQVDRVRAAVQRSAPQIRRIKEEGELLPVVTRVSAPAALAVRLELEERPWLRVAPASQRVAHDADALVHVLGRLGAASPERIAEDPLRGDELRALRPIDRCGVSGVERVGELALRGRRGRIVESYDHRVLERSDPVAGRNVFLTIDLELQQHVLGLLAQAAAGCANPAGAAAVVIDVATREVRALVSYPVYAYERFAEDYELLRQDARGLPLLFRAVQAQYPPGSTCKAITLLGGLGEGVVTARTRFHCTGYLLPEQPDRFRCWIYNLNPGITHDITDDPAGQDAESAVRNSCNLYFYQVGGLLGPQRLCAWFERLGLGRPQGTGLIEESPGVVPTEEWLLRYQGRRHQPADAWNYSIGQGEVTVTPLQAANVAATIAAGYWAPVRLACDETGQALGAPPAAVTLLDDEHLRVLRAGMWRVVNERGGTGHWARLERDDYVLCGKTGSAQTPPRVVSWRYTCQWPDGRRAEVIAPTREDALARFDDDRPEIVGWRAHETYPPRLESERLPAHAWFIGFTQPADTPRGARPAGRVYAISVIVEFGESGGRVAGPVIRQIAEYLLSRADE